MGNVTIVTFSSTLMQKARKVGQARLYGTPKELAEAEAELAEYEQLVRISDKFQIDMPDPRIFKNI